MRRALTLLSGCGRRGCHHVVRSPHGDVTVPPVSAADYVWAGLGAVGDRPAFVAADTGARVSYAELRERCRGLASWLDDNLPPAAGVAVLLPNSPAFAVAALGSLEAGRILAALSPDATVDEILRLLRGTDTRCVITTSRKIFTVLEAKAMLEKEAGRSLPLEVVATDREVRFRGVHNLDTVTRDGRELGAGRADTAAVRLDNGRVTHGALVAACRQVGWVSPAESAVAALPPMHGLYGLSQVLLRGLARGATLVTMAGLGPQAAVRALRAHGVTALPAAAGLARFLASGNVSKDDLSGLRSLTVTAPLPRAQLDRLLDLLPEDAELAQLYAAPAGGVVFHLPRSELRPGSVGRPLPGTEAKVVAADGEQAAGGPGEICVRGPQLPSDQWERTGDLGYYDSDGFFYVTGRGRGLVDPSTDLEFRPDELEGILRRHPDVAEAAVLAAGCPAKGRSSIAVVVPADAALPPPPKELLNYLEEHVAPHKWISRVVFAKSLPKRSDGSLNRDKLHEQFADKQEQEMVALSYV